MLSGNFPAVTTAQGEEFQEFHRQDGGRFSCRNCQTAEFAAIVSGRTSSHSASCFLIFNGPLSGAVIAVGRGEKKENKRQAAAPEAPSHADFRVLTWSELILQIFQRVKKIEFPLCSQRMVSMIFAK